jgi:hypothetical protein
VGGGGGSSGIDSDRTPAVVTKRRSLSMCKAGAGCVRAMQWAVRGPGVPPGLWMVEQRSAGTLGLVVVRVEEWGVPPCWWSTVAVGGPPNLVQ